MILLALKALAGLAALALSAYLGRRNGVAAGHRAGVAAEQERLLQLSASGATGNFETPGPPPFEDFAKFTPRVITHNLDDSQRATIADRAVAVYADTPVDLDPCHRPR